MSNAKFKVGCSFDDNLLDVIRTATSEYGNKIYEVFGSIAAHQKFRARPSRRIPDVSEREMFSYIEKLHGLGLKFNYTLNAAYLGSAAELPSVKSELKALVARLIAGGVDSFTVSLPYAAEIIREVSPTVGIEVSTIAEVTSIGQIESWRQQYAVNAVCLDITCNREIALLKAMGDYADKAGITLVALANEFCGVGIGSGVSKCIYRKQCYDLHTADYTKEDIAAIGGFPFVNCIQSRSMLSQWLKMEFIRPEDIEKYVGIGINHFKLTGRSFGDGRFSRLVEAYCGERYDGKLSDLARFQSVQTDEKTVCDMTAEIDNTTLGEFVDYWFDNPSHRCATQLCGVTCRYCDEYYRKHCILEK